MFENKEFWELLDKVLETSEIIIDRPKGSCHPKYPETVYHLDYGYLNGISSMDGDGLDVWVGSGEKKIDAVMCIVDLGKKDSEIKLLIGCTDDEKKLVHQFHNRYESMKGMLILRNN